VATRCCEDPYDQTRPLWQFVIIDGLEGGRGALFWKLHTISDGIGLIRTSKAYMSIRTDMRWSAK
jgi:diacylglycerol O-acyltransferase / wax synthase